MSLQIGERPCNSEWPVTEETRPKIIESVDLPNFPVDFLIDRDSVHLRELENSFEILGTSVKMSLICTWPPVKKCLQHFGSRDYFNQVSSVRGERPHDVQGLSFQSLRISLLLEYAATVTTYNLRILILRGYTTYPQKSNTRLTGLWIICETSFSDLKR